MTFSNPIVAGEELIRSSIKSENYVAGVSGWRIGREGNAEFSEITARGDIESIGVSSTARLNGGSLVIEDNANPVTLSRLTISTLEFQDGDTNNKGNVVYIDHATMPMIGLTAPITTSRGVFFHGSLGFLVSTGVFSAVEGWNNFPFAAGWTADQPCQYKLMPDGIVRLRGIGNFNVSPIPNGTTVCTLPAGYRPPQYTIVPIAFDASATKGRCEVATTGVVKIYDAPNDLPSFDSVSFSSI